MAPGRATSSRLISVRPPVAMSSLHPSQLIPDPIQPQAQGHAPQTEMRLLLICHAEGMHDRYANFAGEESGLTARGWEQADILAGWLQNYCTIDTLVSDSLLHSRLTAQRIGQALGLPVAVNRELPLCPRGEWQALDARLVGARSLQALAQLQEEALPPPYADFCRQLVASVDRLVAEHWGSTLALVTSGDNIATLLRYFFGAHRLDIQIDHTSLSEVNYQGRRWRLAYTNRLEHLPRPVPRVQQVNGESKSDGEPMEDLSLVVQVYNRLAQADLQRKRTDDETRLRHLLQFAKIPPDARVLDIGTGLGVLPLMLAEAGARSVVGIDICPTMLEQAEYLRLSRLSPAAQRVSFRLAPAQALPFADESFDVVFCRLVLHHARKPERIIQEAARVLRPGGMLILAELLSADNPVKRATQNAIEERRNPAHVAARTADQYNKLVVDQGLTIEAREVVSFERELEEWIAGMQTDPADVAVVREMIEAGLETDAAGINARRQGNTLVFEQRMYYVKAVKPRPSE
uniref:Methyltransferase domain-containing protein n=2 Tax=Litorilinea aerophila TaxID=1204385 RepID=A0A540VGR3_9CHLR